VKNRTKNIPENEKKDARYASKKLEELPCHLVHFSNLFLCCDGFGKNPNVERVRGLSSALARGRRAVSTSRRRARSEIGKKNYGSMEAP
jgi:hypothetical protein